MKASDVAVEPKVAVVTGAGSGIGRATVLALASAGYSVALLGRRTHLLDETATLSGASSRCRAFVVDVSKEAQVCRAFDGVMDVFGRIDVLFNNAGYFAATRPVDEVALQDWQAVIDINLTGAFLCAREAFRHMKSQTPRGGRIINNGSISAHSPRPNSIAYTASKHAITGLTKALSLEGRDWGIACGQIDVGNAATVLTTPLGTAALQANGTISPEPMMDVSVVAEAVLMMASLPLSANVQSMMVMATTMPFMGRG